MDGIISWKNLQQIANGGSLSTPGNGLSLWGMAVEATEMVDSDSTLNDRDILLGEHAEHRQDALLCGQPFCIE